MIRYVENPILDIDNNISEPTLRMVVIRSRTRRVKNWQDHVMVVRWVAASLLDMEEHFKRIMGYQQLWMLEAKLRELAEEGIDEKSKVA